MYDRAGRPTIMNPPTGRGARARAPVVRIARLRLALAAGDHGSSAIAASRRTPRAHGGGRGAVSPLRRPRANSTSLASRNRSISGQSLTRVPSRRAPLPPNASAARRGSPRRGHRRGCRRVRGRSRELRRGARDPPPCVIVARFWHHTRQEASHSVAVLEFAEHNRRQAGCQKRKFRIFPRTDVRERRVASPPSL